MTCERYQIQMMDAIDGAGAPAGPLAEHIGECPECHAAWADVSTAFSALGALTPVRAPAAATEPIRRRLATELGKRKRSRVPVEPMLALGFGTLSALLSLAVLGFRMDLRGQPAWTLVPGAVAWTMMFVLAFWLVLRPRDGRRDLGRLVATGLGATGVFLVADHLLPLTRVVQFCYRSSWAREHLGVLGLQGAWFVVGAGYALVPLFLLSLATGKEPGRQPLRSGLVAGGMFFFLLAPAIFIQCSAFTAGALVAWLGGAVVGSTVGGVAGYWLRRHAFG